MKPNFDLNQIGDLYVFIPNASIYANAVLTYGGVKIFSVWLMKAAVAQLRSSQKKEFAQIFFAIAAIFFRV